MLDHRRREIVLESLSEICQYRRWVLLAAHVAGEPELALLGTALRAPGTPIAIGAAGCAVACGEGYVVLDRVVPPGRRAMSGREFASIHARSGLVRSVPA